MRPRRGIIRMRPIRRVRDNPAPIFLQSIRIPIKCLAICMLAIPHSCRGAIGESNHVVFPVAYMIAEFMAENRVPLIVRVEVHVKGVDGAILMIVHDDGAGDGVGRCAGRVGRDAKEVGGGGLGAEVGGAGQVYEGAAVGVRDVVQAVEVGEVERGGVGGGVDVGVVELRVRVCDLRADV